MSAFAAAVAALFNDPNLAATATYQPVAVLPDPPPDPFPVRVMMRRPDTLRDFGSARLWTESVMVDVRVADVAQPAEGDGITIGTDSYVVQGEPQRDRERLVWTLDLRPA